MAQFLGSDAVEQSGRVPGIGELFLTVAQFLGSDSVKQGGRVRRHQTLLAQAMLKPHWGVGGGGSGDGRGGDRPTVGAGDRLSVLALSEPRVLPTGGRLRRRGVRSRIRRPRLGGVVGSFSVWADGSGFP